MTQQFLLCLLPPCEFLPMHRDCKVKTTEGACSCLLGSCFLFFLGSIFVTQPAVHPSNSRCLHLAVFSALTNAASSTELLSFPSQGLDSIELLTLFTLLILSFRSSMENWAAAPGLLFSSYLSRHHSRSTFCSPIVTCSCSLCNTLELCVWLFSSLKFC